MGFLDGLFKKKRGGTFVGNLLRGAANTVSDGLIGNGAQLSKWESEQDELDYKEQYKKRKESLLDNPAYNIGNQIGNASNKHLPPIDEDVRKNVTSNAIGVLLKKYALYIAGGLLALILCIWFIIKKLAKN